MSNGKSSHWVRYLIIGIAGLCLIRVFSVSAAERDVYEIYDSQEKGEVVDREVEWTKAAAEPEIRLTRPGEDADRTEETGYALVSGSYRLNAVEKDSIAVPKVDSASKGRGIASDDAPLTTNNVYVPKNAAEEFLFGGVTDSQIKASSVRAVQEVSLIVSEQGFFPKQVAVTQGVPVKVYLSASGSTTLCFMMDQWGVKKGVAPGKVEEFSFTPTSPGSFRFYCPVTSIEGTLVVREPSIESPNRVVASERAAGESSEQKVEWKNEPKNAAMLRALIED